jgi:ABC-2 type transport system ATP-binding protein
MSQMAIMADHVILIGHGKLLRDEGMTQFVDSTSERWVLVRAAQLEELSARLTHAGAQVKPGPLPRVGHRSAVSALRRQET